MTRTVNCVKLGKEAEGLATAPYPGDLGQRIFDNVSKEAWQLWLRHQTILINEHRISPVALHSNNNNIQLQTKSN